MENAKILIIEDDRQIARIIELELRHNDYDVQIAYDGPRGLERVNAYDPDLILLDIMLPGLDGMEVCKEIRSYSSVPIIMLTAKDQTLDKVSGLDIGANDYITKPFEMRELLARIRAAIRVYNVSGQNSKILILADLSMDLTKHVVTRGEKYISLTKKEYDLLGYLLKNKGLVLSREQILNTVWDIDYEGEDNVVDVYIRYLRSKIDDDFIPKLIHTVRGFGYLLENRSAND